VTLPKLSIAAKLYAIFVLMATISLGLSVIAVAAARHHAALTNEFESANAGTWNVERVNALIYAVIVEARSIDIASNSVAAQEHISALLKANEEIGRVIDTEVL
jgi:methyl-accepting chemotaxis protein